MPFLHNDKFRIFYPKNTISWAGVWWLAGYVVAGETRFNPGFRAGSPVKMRLFHGFVLQPLPVQNLPLSTCLAAFYSPRVSLHRDQLFAPLKQYFGFASFRPLQEEIIRDSLAGRDVFAVLPTGGGKSLCFQLPALVRPGLTVVVSPLIALMKDQVDALQAAGVPATFLNSSLGAGGSRPRLRGLHGGEFRLLYVAPERLMLSGFLDDLKKWNVSLFAIDEAHCISEWGHDFRPEYRQISALRGLFPDVPMMALTATATERVRGGHRQTTPSALARVLRRQFQPPEPDLPRRGQVRRLRADSFLRPRAAGRKRDHLCPGAQDGGEPGGQTYRRRREGVALSRGPGGRRPFGQSGGVSSRRGARGVRHHRVRHGHQQAERALRDSLRSAEEHRGLLPGNRPRGPRRPARRMPVAVQPRRPRQADAVH